MYYANYSRCLPEERLTLTLTPVDRLLQHYVFPVQFLFGILGNTVNLWVLSSDHLKNRANDLLASVSFADLTFLLLMLPHCLATFVALERDITFRFIYFYFKQNLGALANWMSACAIWLILAVSIERFLVIKSPLRSRIYWKGYTKVSVIGSIFATTGVLTFYHHFAYDCQIFYMCSGRQLAHACYSAAVEEHPSSWMDDTIVQNSLPKRLYIRISTVGNAVMVVFIPMMMIIFLNVMIIHRLHQSSGALRNEASGSQSIIHVQMRQKRRVTMTVVAIATCFTITQAPSAIMVLYELFVDYTQQSAQFYTIFSITNCLVVTGKTTNFILFCVASIHFRRKCEKLFIRKARRLSRGSFGTALRQQSTFRASVSSSRRPSQTNDLKATKFVAELLPLEEISHHSTSNEL